MKQSMFAGMVMLVVGVIAVQSMRVDASAQSLTQVSPFELMQNSGNLPVDRIEYPY